MMNNVLHPQPGYPFAVALDVSYTLTETGLAVALRAQQPLRAVFGQEWDIRDPSRQRVMAGINLVYYSARGSGADSLNYIAQEAAAPAPAARHAVMSRWCHEGGHPAMRNV